MANPEGQTTKKNTALLFWLSWTGIALIYIACRINAIGIPLERDEGLFGYMGQVILGGGTPYLDAIDHKPPLVYFIYALGLQFVPPTATGIHLFLQTYNFFSLIALFFAVRLYTNSNAPALWAGFCYAIFSSSPSIQGYSASTEMFMLLPLCLSLLCAVAAAKKGKMQYVLLSGVCGALCCWFKHTGIFPALFPVFYMTGACMQNDGPIHKKIKAAAAVLFRWSAGFLLVSFIIAGYFSAQGAFNDFLYWVFTFNFQYSSGPGLLRSLSRVAGSLQKITLGNPALVIALLFAVCTTIWRKNSKGIFISGFLVMSLLATVPGYAYAHYFAQLAPAVALAAGIGCAFLCTCVRNPAQRTALILAIGACITAPLILEPGYYFHSSSSELSRKFFGSNPFPESADIAAYIQSRTTEDETIFIYGSEAQILFYAQRKSASPFVLLYPLTREIYPRYRHMQLQAWQDIISNNPRYVLLVKVPASELWDGRADRLLFTNILQDIRKRFSLEAVMTIELPKGSLLVGTGENSLQKTAGRLRRAVYIFRRNG